DTDADRRLACDDLSPRLSGHGRGGDSAHELPPRALAPQIMGIVRSAHLANHQRLVQPDYRPAPRRHPRADIAGLRAVPNSPDPGVSALRPTRRPHLDEP